MNPHFPDAIRKAIDEGHPLASELYEAWLDVTQCHALADYLTIRQLWEHAARLERGPNS